MTILQNDSKWDCVIIGGGLSGLVAANYLSQHFKEVLVVEKSHNLGGRAITNEIKGCYFNLGPHALYKKGNGLKILKELNVKIDGTSPPFKGKLVKEQISYNMPFSIFHLPFTKLLNWKEKIEFIKIFLRIFRVDSLNMDEETLENWVNKNISYENVRDLFYTITRLSTYSNSPHLVQAKVILKQVKLSLGGTIYVDKGWQTIIDHLKDKAEQSGVTFATGHSVQKLSGNTPNFLVHFTNKTTISSRYVISTASPKDTAKFLEPRVPKKLNQLLQNAIPIKGASLDIALRKLPNPKIHLALSMDSPYYYSNHSNSAKLTQDKNEAVIHVFKYLADGEEVNHKKLKQELEQFLDYLQPCWKNEVITSRFLPSMYVSYLLQTSNVEHLLSNLETDISGLFIAGEWTNQNGILADSAISSGKNVAELLLKTVKEC